MSKGKYSGEKPFSVKPKKISSVLRRSIVARAVILIIPFVILTRLKPGFPPLHKAFFDSVVYLLGKSGLEFTTAGNMIMAGNFSAQMVFDCTGWMQMYLFCALIFLPPGISARGRLKGLLFLIPLFLYNVLRAALTVYVGATNYPLFLPVHYFLWETAFLGLIFVFWIFWLEKYRPRHAPPSKAKPAGVVQPKPAK
ncbi:MAG: hypothetical protein ACP5E4_02210, partial [Candidatus Aenigmatarchaeota archaeon]